jgi:hypothetical protein
MTARKSTPFSRGLRKTNRRGSAESSPAPAARPIPAIRAHLPKAYGLRDYPAITHTVRCQYEVPFWDPADSLTLGREPPNPRPTFYKMIHGCFSHFTDGYISYSDGVNDDVNKAVWLRLGWQPDANVREALVQYARFFFGSEVAQDAADGILALEKNWEGPLATNGAVDGTLALWQHLERRKPELAGNWRWQLCLLRAYYDAYTRHRLLYETRLEREADRVLEKAPVIGAAEAMAQALARLRLATEAPVKTDWRARIEALCGELYQSIRLQTSVPRYHAIGYERGCVLDFVDVPLNNRWWLEDEFAQIGKLPSEAEKVRGLTEIARWENPGSGSYYDEVGHIAKSPHVIRGEGLNTDPLMERNPNPTYWWWDEGKSRKRLSVADEYRLAARARVRRAGPSGRVSRSNDRVRRREAANERAARPAHPVWEGNWRIQRVSGADRSAEGRQAAAHLRSTGRKPPQLAAAVACERGVASERAKTR